jgi:hypothetical protein
VAKTRTDQETTGLAVSPVNHLVTARKPIGIEELLRVIGRLPADKPIDNPRVWYRTQKEHWIGWLEQYDGPGAYGRKIGIKRDARFAYNHIVCPPMLLWLAQASAVPSDLVRAALDESAKAPTLHQKSATIRRYVPWDMMAKALWRR